jgi:D-lactate dehydrogenase
MKILFYSVKPYEKSYLLAANKNKLQINFIDVALTLNTVQMAKGYDAICIFTSDDASKDILEALKKMHIQHIILRSAGYDHIDLQVAKKLQITVANVPDYSPYAIAEHAVALILALNRKLIIANKQLGKKNFTTDNLIGFDLYQKTVGIIGLGRIGSVFASIMHGFGCKLLGFDLIKNYTLAENFGLINVSLDKLLKSSDIISIHTNLSSSTKYIINKKSLASMKKNAMLINTSRGGCVHTIDVMDALDRNKIASFGADVYEKEKGVFFYDLSKKQIKDKMLQNLLSRPNVIITPHQAFATHEALNNIANSTFYSLNKWKNKKPSKNEIMDI